MKYSFENLEVWNLSIELSDMIYLIIKDLPEIEKFNIISQVIRATTSINLNIAEGSIETSKKEKSRYLKISLHSLIEVIACLRLIERRKYKTNEELMEIELLTNKLFAKLNAFIRSIK